MNKPLFTFEPFHQSLDLWSIAFMGCIAVSLTVIYFFLNKLKLDSGRRNIIRMLLGFLAVIASGFFLLRLLSQAKLKTVSIYNNRIETPYGEVRLQDIRDYYIKIERKYKPLNPNEITDSTRYFFIHEKSDKTHVLSEGDYLIDSILFKLNYVVDN